MCLPLKTLGDEHYHAYVPIPILRLISQHPPLPVPLLTWGLIILGFLSIRFGRRKVKINLRGSLLLGIVVVLAFVYCLVLIRSGLVEKINPGEHLFRFPPLGKSVHLIFYLLFGVSEFTARLPQVLFLALASVYVYRTALLYRDQLTSFNAAALFLFTPALFHFGHHAFLTGGVLFFTAASFYYFSRYLKEDQLRDLLLAVFFSSIGFLYKRLLLAVLIIILAYLLLRDLTRDRKNLAQNLKSHLILAWIALVSIIPWLVLGYKYSSRNYAFVIDNWTNFESITQVVREIPLGGTYLLFFLFAAGIIYAFWKRRDKLTYFCFSFFLLYYLFVNSDSWRGLRITLPLWLPVFILIGQFLGGAKIREQVRWSISLLLTGYMLVASTIVNIPPLEEKYTLIKDIENGYLPYPQTFAYVRDNLPPGSRIYAPAGCEPSHFYLYHYQLDNTYTWERKFWVEDKEEQDLDNLYAFCKREKFPYLVLSRKKWVRDWINGVVVEELFIGKDPRFKAKEIFTYGDNQIILWEVMEAKS